MPNNKNKKVGRPLTKINWKMLENLASIQCTGEEMAGVLNVDYKTLERACKREHNINFGEWIEQKRAGGKASLRKMQYDNAKNGNVTMQIWLGKNWLGQKDKQEEETSTDTMSDVLSKLIDKLPS